MDNELKHCPDVNNRSNRSVLNVAVHGYGKEYGRIILNLLQYGFTVNPEDVNNCELLYAAVEKGYLKIVEEILKYGIDVNKLYKPTYAIGCVPLHVAAQYKEEEVAKFLLSYGADVNARDGNGKIPIFYAAIYNIFKIVELLLEHGVDVNTSDEHRRTPLHFAAEGQLDVVKVLLKFDADIDSQDEWGNTALHIASSARCTQNVEALLEHGSDINIMSKNNETPLDVAIAGVQMCRIREAEPYSAFARDARAFVIIVVILKRHGFQMKIANLYVSEKKITLS